MEKAKIEKIILLVIIPLFLLSFIYLLSRSRIVSPGKKGYKAPFLEEGLGIEAIDMVPPADTLNVKYKGSGRDPLKDVLQLFLDKLQTQPQPGPVKPLPGLTIQGLLWNSDMPQAIINGKVLGIGDTVEGLKILKISKEGITVDYAGEPVFIKK